MERVGDAHDGAAEQAAHHSPLFVVAGAGFCCGGTRTLLLWRQAYTAYGSSTRRAIAHRAWNVTDECAEVAEASPSGPTTGFSAQPLRDLELVPLIQLLRGLVVTRRHVEVHNNENTTIDDTNNDMALMVAFAATWRRWPSSCRQSCHVASRRMIYSAAV